MVEPFSLNTNTEALYRELKRIADAQMRRERADHTLSATALVNEAYVRLAAGDRAAPAARADFLAAAANLMRQILVDHARARLADKRGGDWSRLTLTTALSEQDVAWAEGQGKAVDVLALDDALAALAALDPRQAEMVVLRYFGGLSIEDTAQALACSVATVKRDWLTAKLFLRDRLG